MEDKDLIKILTTLVALPHESEWVEFKHNFHSPEEIGERISALSNSAALCDKSFAYIVFGIEDGTHEIVGTTFHAKAHKKGNEELELWLLNRLSPRINFESYEFDVDGKHISMYRIPATSGRPVTFLNEAYIRVGSLTKKLSGYPEKESKLWHNDTITLSETIVKDKLEYGDVQRYLSAETYFDLLKLPMPKSYDGILERFESEKFIVKNELGFGITELGAILLAKNLRDFSNLYRKSIRVIVYKGTGKLETIREQIFEQGYAVCFKTMVDWVNGQLPANEEIGRALRKEVRMYPEIAIREIAANMIIHQNFAVLGFPMIEIYSDRVEISSPGQPLISPDRFIDNYQSRNEDLADIMRRMGFCEEKGSGIDKAVAAIEEYQLPAFKVRISEIRTSVIVQAFKPWLETTKEERIQACYQHACLKYMMNDMLTNKSLRERLGVEEKNYPLISTVIKDTLAAGLIKVGTPEGTNRRNIAYIPIWG
jgi:predicted HTH transcriptional regulator